MAKGDGVAKFKVGDWCFYNFRPYRVAECIVDEEGVWTKILHDTHSPSGCEIQDDCFPLSDWGLIVSERYREAQSLLQHCDGYYSLKTTAIEARLREHWRGTMRGRGTSEDWLHYRVIELCVFAAAIQSYIRHPKGAEVMGVRVLRDE